MISHQAPVAVDNNPNPAKQNRISTCLCCRIKFESNELQRVHFKSLESFNEIQAAASRFVDLSKKPPDRSSKQESELDEDGDEDDWVSIDEDELVDEDYDEEEAEELLARVIKSDTCLFCDKKSSSTKVNVNHMNLVHGFFVPEEQYLIDLEGLMEYLGFKVGAGATCLWCNKQFTSVHGVRRHMINKDHCKIFYNQDKAVDEFKEFYDYSTQEKFEMKPMNQLVVAKRRHERRSGFTNRSLAKSNSSTTGDGRALIKKSGHQLAKPYQARAIKKFDAIRAKVMLKIAYSNNQTMRGRLRQQNPI